MPVAKVEDHIAAAVAKGTQVLTGGKRHALDSTIFEATIVTGATRAMILAQEKSFSRIALLFRFETVEDGIDLANDTILGLAACFHARDLSRVTQAQEALEHGLLGVNTDPIWTAPFGGVRQSGLGREGGRDGTRNSCRRNISAPPFNAGRPLQRHRARHRGPAARVDPCGRGRGGRWGTTAVTAPVRANIVSRFHHTTTTATPTRMTVSHGCASGQNGFTSCQ